MPDYCNFDMVAKGKPENIQKLIDWMNAKYIYEDGKNEVYLEDSKGNITPIDHHLGYRVEEVWCDDVKERSYILGYCAYSVWCCMFYGKGSYLEDFKAQKEKRLAVSLPEACKMLKLDVEIYSREPSDQFAEHYLITNKGEIKINEATLYVEYQVGDYEVYFDFTKEYGEEALTKDEFDSASDSVVAKCKWVEKGSYDFKFNI